MEAYPVGHVKSGDHCDDSSRFALCKGVILYATVSGPVLSNLRTEHTGFEMAPSFRFGQLATPSSTRASDVEI